LIDTTRKEWEKVMAINATGYFLFCREAAKAMPSNKQGAIVNIASYASFSMAASASRSLDAEFADWLIRS
jgi:NAD(P)-dependent dehydrogenase (short-subunit alcohol dehydrogenase family)